MTKRLITAQELIQAPTGFDWNTIAETTGATNALEAVEQANLIDRASDWVSNYCYMRLDATTDNEQARVSRGATKAWVNRDGWLVFHTDYFPVLSVSAMSWAYAHAGQGTLAFNALTAANLILEGEGYRVNRVCDISQDWFSIGLDPGLVKLTYVNGWPNMVLGANAAAGSNVNLVVDTSLGCTSTPGSTGIGATLTVYDGANTEVVTVTAVPDATHVTVASLANNHSAGVRVSALPSDIAWATIQACLHFARGRGVDAVVMSGSAGAGEQISEKGDEALAEAEYLLQPYRRIL
ncbi:MAG: hypothetical protein ACYDAY_11440 [Candidatus Dormibacteria bacterium]